MKIKSLLIILTFTLLFALNGVAQRVEWSVDYKQVAEQEYDLIVKAAIPSDWHIYDLNVVENGPNPTIITFSPKDDMELIGDITTNVAATRKFEEAFDSEIGYYSDEVEFTQRIKTNSNSINVAVEYMMCNDMSCMPPVEEEMMVVLSPDKQKDSDSSIWMLILEAIAWGFAALLTPCVFPMIPMTVSFFMKGDHSPAKGRFMALMYGAFIITLYTLPIAVIILITRLAGGESVTSDIFNWLATHWLPNIVFFIVFMLFAASFFGAFEITLPSWLVNKSDQRSESKGLGGLLFMSMTLVLVSFSCTGPIVGSVLIKSTAGEFWEPIITMLAFSVAFALPFVLLAFFPALIKKLPKSGGWLNSVKVILGFIEIALGLKFLSVADQTYHWGILDREVYLAIWIVVFTLLGFYLLGKLRFAHDSESKHVSVVSLFLAIATFSFVVYLIPGMFGAPLKGLSGYLPPMHTQDFNLLNNKVSSTVSESNSSNKYSDFLHLPHGLSGFFDYEEALNYANEVGKPLFIDFTGHGCVNCREMEAKVWSDPEVLKLLNEEFVIVALYSDDKTILPEEQWTKGSNGKVLKSLGKINSDFIRHKYGAAAQPHYIIADGNGNELSSRSYNLDVPGYLEFLRKGIDQYNK